jgi:arylsulfatase A-like enzyme
MFNYSGFWATLSSLWFRLMTLSALGLMFAAALFLARARVQGWTFYLTPGEVLFEIMIRLIFAALAGLAAGTVLSALSLPILWIFRSSHARAAECITSAAVVVVLFADSRFSLTSLIKWSNRGVRFTGALVAAHALFFILAILVPRARRMLVGTLDHLLDQEMTRNIALATLVAATSAGAAQFAFARALPPERQVVAAQKPKGNFLLITFDALDAEDMSLYGYHLATTPNIDAFARQATVFNNFYSASTFTTPSVATMLTGKYPSEHRVYHLKGRIGDEIREQSLPHAMHAAGYSTGAFFSNPFAYYLGKSFESEFDNYPQPNFQYNGIRQVWDMTGPLHQESGFGSRIDEYFDLEDVWNNLTGLPGNLSMRMRPQVSFGQARQLLEHMDDGFFLWVHVITPHDPYMPADSERGKFLPMSTLPNPENEVSGKWKPHYLPDDQDQIDKRRLRYDEFIATADREFGEFMKQIEKSGRLENTTVIISADHGESFEGGVYQHQTPYLTRPVIHIPLIIRTPGQKEPRRVDYTADQTALAPTILELAGVAKPQTMRGDSLGGWVKGESARQRGGYAFTQYLEKNSIFEPLRHGTIGVMDGEYQYVFYLDEQKGALRHLPKAHIWDLDLTAANPARAEAMREAIQVRFPELRPGLSDAATAEAAHGSRFPAD